MLQPSSQLKALCQTSDVAQDDNWMLSYIDVFVLITTLFLMLLVMNKPEMQMGEDHHSDTLNPSSQLALESELKDVSEVKPSASEAGTDSNMIDLINQLPPSASGEEALRNKALIEKLEHSVEEYGLSSHVHIAQSEFNTRLEIQSRVLFDSGDAYLTRSGEAVLDKLLPLVRDTKANIIVEGHTDNLPISTAKYPSNWNLAAARATEVLDFFVSEGLNKDRFRAVSYGDTRPLVPNNSDSNRKKNRRVSLVIEQQN